MDRKFKVGDIVNASSNGTELTEKPVKEISGYYFRVEGLLFAPSELTLVTSVETNRGVEQYKDQFAPWVPFKDVTSRELIPDNDNEKIMMLNVLIFLLPKEKQA